MQKNTKTTVANVEYCRQSNEELFRQGFECLKRGEALGALKYFDEVGKDHSPLPDLHFARSIALAQIGKLNPAKEACQRELMLQPDHIGAKRFLERLKDATGDFDKIQSPRRNRYSTMVSQNCVSDKNICHAGCGLTEPDTGQSTFVQPELITSNDLDLKLAKIKGDLENNIFAYTSRVSIELSNLCNYASIHKKCPLNIENQHIILSRRIVEKVIDSMAVYNFKGTIAFHTYNEPMMDPRLFLFIRYANQKCPECEVMIMTNGYYFNQTMADELVEVGAGSIYVSAYTKNDLHRLEKIQLDIPYIIQEYQLDDRLNLYDKVPRANRDQTPCYSPLNEIIITRDGQVSLCCLDWKRKHCFGNLYKESLEDVILLSNMATVYNLLSNGNRTFKICKVCGWSRNNLGLNS